MTRPRRLGWVTAAAVRGRDDDEPVALAAFGAAGVDVSVVDWHDVSVDWSAFDRVVIRSTWDYPERIGEFLAWLDAVERVTEVRNPPTMIRWNVDKRYLAELQRAGVPVTPTVFVHPGEPPVFPDVDFVVKPAIGAGSRDAAAYDADERRLAAEHVARLHARSAVLIQPVVTSVAADGEWPLMFIDGRYSHAANKRVSLPRASSVDGLHANESATQYEPNEAQLAVAEAAIEFVTARFGAPLYARVDVVTGNDGKPCILELELVEPSLFLPFAGAATVAAMVEAFAPD
jgi:glutathione synthase/RimK-type ligase-like ATP-grasp enzyme